MTAISIGGREISRAIVSATLAGLVAGGLAGWGAAALTSGPGACDSERVSRDVLPSVVTVFASGSGGGGSGSGAIMRSDGTIVTNDHVIAPAGAAGQLSVLLNNGELRPASLVGTDPKTDLAVVKIDGGRLPTIAMGADQRLRVGQPVVALGAPLGLSGTVTTGIVSALGRDITAPTGSGGTAVLVGNIQTDASINPGNSGGPLVDCSGRLVGVNTAISTVPNASGVPGGGSVGIGFAVPVRTVERITSQLIRDGRATHPWLGMVTVDVTADMATRFGTRSGVYVLSVTAGGPAAQAGIRQGEIVTSVNGVTASDFEIARLLATSTVGAEVSLEVIREGSPMTVRVVLAEAP